MVWEEIKSVCEAQGLRCNDAAQTISGVRAGVAFLADLSVPDVLVSLNIGEKQLPRLAQALQPMGEVRVTPDERGVRLSLPAAVLSDGAALLRFLDTVAAEGAALATASFNDRFEKDGESPLAYFRGILGALVGALVGVLPWFLLEHLLGFQFWYCGVLVGIASFFGYRYLWGAHKTRFAWVTIGVCSLLAILLSETVTAVWDLMTNVETLDTVGKALSCLLENVGVTGLLGDALFGLIACAVGLFGMRGKILLYTHESNYLRRGRRR